MSKGGFESFKPPLGVKNFWPKSAGEFFLFCHVVAKKLKKTPIVFLAFFRRTKPPSIKTVPIPEYSTHLEGSVLLRCYS